MTDLPVWLQEIRDHAEEAQGPWWVTIARGASGGSMYEVTTAPWKHAPNVFPLSQASMEKLVYHPYVPRLVELVGEMAKALEEAQELLDDLRGAARDAGDWRVLDDIDAAEAHSKAALRKYYGEVNDNDRIA